MILNSLKRLVRQPVKCLIFLLLLTGSTALVVGLVLSLEGVQRIQAVEDSYTTIGTVHQGPVGTDVSSSYTTCWGAFFDETEVYAPAIPLDVLDFPGAEYITPPEKRPYFLSYLPELNHQEYNAVDRHILEFTPVEPFEEDAPTQVEVTKVLSSDINEYSANIRGGNCPDKSMEVGDRFYFCQCFGDVPVYPLEQGEKYVANLFLYRRCNVHDVPEYGLYSRGVASTQCDGEGNLIDHGAFSYNTAVYGELKGPQQMLLRQVDEDFYQPGHMGEIYEKWAQSYEMEPNLFLTTCTNSLNLLPSWHTDRSRLSRGREITPEEFASGAAVCMVHESAASKNLLDIGDKITLPLLCAYDGALNGAFPFEASLLDADGGFYEPFWEQEYEIVGAYSSPARGGEDLVGDMFIIPTNSIGASWENHRMHYGPMDRGTTSFQIGNGAIQAFDQALREAVPEAAGLTITYDDLGYSEIMSSLNASRNVALLLLFSSLLAALAVTALLLYFFVVREKKRTAIERSLGMSKRQCRVSLLAGMLILTLAAVASGSLCGHLALNAGDAIPQTEAAQTSPEASGLDAEETGEAGESPKAQDAARMDSEYVYSTRYSASAPSGHTIDNVDADVRIPPLVYLWVPAGLWLLVLASSLLLLTRSFRAEPIYLLSWRGEKQGRPVENLRFGLRGINRGCGAASAVDSVFESFDGMS